MWNLKWCGSSLIQESNERVMRGALQTRRCRQSLNNLHLHLKSQGLEKATTTCVSISCKDFSLFRICCQSYSQSALFFFYPTTVGVSSVCKVCVW